MKIVVWIDERRSELYEKAAGNWDFSSGEAAGIGAFLVRYYRAAPETEESYASYVIELDSRE